jgi:hypothetical protein
MALLPLTINAFLSPTRVNTLFYQTRPTPGSSEFIRCIFIDCISPSANGIAVRLMASSGISIG